MSKQTPSPNKVQCLDDDILDMDCTQWSLGSQRSQDDFRVQQVVLLLQDAGWLQKYLTSPGPQLHIREGSARTPATIELPNFTKEKLTQWKKNIALQETAIATAQ